jgi:hypothetical protein
MDEEGTRAPVAVDGGHPAWLDVRKGRRWVGAKVPGLVTVADGELRFTITERRLGKRERQAIGRLADEHALAQVLARDPYVLRIPLSDDVLSFPSVPGLGRSTIRVRMPGHPDLAICFLHLGDPLSNPFTLLWRAVSAGPGARRRRDALRDEIRRAIAGERSAGKPT